ncbi:MAG: glutathione S-transferase family protein [Alphaproteobacteria bacterium]|nr:glutathione S-transferase family protein [Alphaproteobacteria bacterium]
MVQLTESDIQTREILDYRGLHLFHYSMSSCSQKLRAFLNVKGVDWEPHVIDLSKQEQNDPWFLGVNPRGLVPVLVDDGAVHIESNDIIAYLERKFPDPVLIPRDQQAAITTLLAREDDLHLDLRLLSFRFVHGRNGSPKSPEVIARYQSGGSGTVGGEPDTHKHRELAFYAQLARDGITDAAVQSAAAKFHAAFADFEQRLGAQAYLIGPDLTIVDIAWYVYAKRLTLAGYPFDRLHPKFAAWFSRLDAQSALNAAVETPAPLLARIAENRRAQVDSGATLAAVAGL